MPEHLRVVAWGTSLLGMEELQNELHLQIAHASVD